jgi:hypothetical protein
MSWQVGLEELSEDAIARISPHLHIFDESSLAVMEYGDCRTDGDEEGAHPILSRSGGVVITHFRATLCSSFSSFFSLREAVALQRKEGDP